MQELLPHDFETRHLFSLQFLARLEVDLERPWTDEAHFHLDGLVNTHNCRICETDNPHSTLQVQLHSPKVMVWCGFPVSFIPGPYFFEELGAGVQIPNLHTHTSLLDLVGKNLPFSAPKKPRVFD
ncbi:UNVERIFIED_CONTAM: hypothetical protein NCL1_27663 [Trichonephila clavipes]